MATELDAIDSPGQVPEATTPPVTTIGNPSKAPSRQPDSDDSEKETTIQLPDGSTFSASATVNLPEGVWKGSDNRFVIEGHEGICAWLPGRSQSQKSFQSQVINQTSK